MEISKKLVGIRIMQRRKAKGLTQEELADQIGLSKNHVSNLECGKYMPTTSIIIKLCGVLGETPDYYLIGKITEETDRIVRLVKTLPIDSQRVVCRLLEVYLLEIGQNSSQDL